MCIILFSRYFFEIKFPKLQKISFEMTVFFWFYDLLSTKHRDNTMNAV